MVSIQSAYLYSFQYFSNLGIYINRFQLNNQKFSEYQAILNYRLKSYTYCTNLNISGLKEWSFAMVSIQSAQLYSFQFFSNLGIYINRFQNTSFEYQLLNYRLKSYTYCTIHFRIERVEHYGFHNRLSCKFLVFQ